MSDFDHNQAEKTGYLTRAVEELTMFVQQHMTQEDARFGSVETKIQDINKKINIMIVLFACVLGVVGGKPALMAAIDLLL